MNTLEKAIKIIVSNEGNYGSVNPNDNGALSIGICQWHGNRALKLCRRIYVQNKRLATIILNNTLIDEIAFIKNETWKNRVLTDIEKHILQAFITTMYGISSQDIQANNDIQSYINTVMKYDITDENSIIFLADICNQGGAGAIKRIINNTFDLYGKHATLDNFMHVAINDKVFKKYKLRRYNVYKKLTGKDYFPAGQAYIHTVAKNETLYGISLKYDIPMKKLVIDNEIKNPNKIYVGQKIKVIKGGV
jgi:hypothetical protein